MKSDHQLKLDVIEELAWEPSINETEIGVEVKGGIVTLSGHLGSYAEKYAAEKATLRVSGVKAIAVEIDVKLPGASQRTDADIAATAQRGLEWNALVPHEKVKVKVEDAWITLTGEVDHEYQRLAAESALRNLLGVVGISNQIKVKPGILPKDVKVNIEAALQRRAHKQTQAISVTVAGDEVTLSGWAPSLAERRAAYLAALSAPGVTRVIDNMQVA